MNPKHKFHYSLAVIIATGLIAGILLATNENNIRNLLVRNNIIKIEQHVSYLSLTYEQQVNDADVIFVGRLTEISPSKWNQDSGEYWFDDASPRAATSIQFHTLKFDISDFIVDKIGAKNLATIDVTVLGPSPLDGNSYYSLAIGDNVIVFAKKTELAWREGDHRKPIIEIVTAPPFAFFVQSNDPTGSFKGKVINDLGKGNFETRYISLPLQDIMLQIQFILQRQPSSQP